MGKIGTHLLAIGANKIIKIYADILWAVLQYLYKNEKKIGHARPIL